MVDVIADNLDLWSAAMLNKSTAGRGTSDKQTAYGIKKLRELILELAVRGKLVPQDPSDEPASVLLERISAEKERLIKEGKIKKQNPLPEINDDEKSFGLPSGWEWVRLQDVSAYIQRGKGPKYADQGQIRVISQKCIQWYGFDLSQAKYVDDDSITSYQPERFLVENDLLWNSTGTGTVGRINVLAEVKPNSLVADSHVTVIRPLKISSNFIWCYISAPGIQQRIEPGSEKALVSGTTNQVELNTSEVFRLVVPIPPLAEQHRIVAKVDELMALCDQLEQQQADSIAAHQTLVQILLDTLTQAADAAEFEQAWTRIADHFDTLFTTESSIDQLKQTLLQLAVMGKLVPQYSNDETVPAVLAKLAVSGGNSKIRRTVPTEVTRSDLVDDKNLPSSWTIESIARLLHLGAIFDLKDGNHGANHPKVSEFTEEGLPFITAAQVSDEGNIDYASAYKVSGSILQRLRVGFANPGDVIYTHKGSVGRVAICNQECVLTPQTTYYRLNPNVLNAGFVRIVLLSPFFRCQVDEVKRQTTRDFVSINAQYKFFLRVAPISEQHRIVAKVEELLALCDALKAHIAAAQTTQLQLADAIVEQAVA